ncbi:MAG: hypothetical protein LBU61_01950 [Coriobacteriales bacterium]|nr:hypothetical protein [Coriobacteriales bacterium]
MLPSVVLFVSPQPTGTFASIRAHYVSIIDLRTTGTFYVSICARLALFFPVTPEPRSATKPHISHRKL